MATIKKYNGSTWENTIARKYETKSEIIVPPTTIYADGSNITTYTIKGNTVQSGTPTPSNPIMPNGVGVRTENLFDVENATETDKYVKNDGTIETGANGDKFLLQTIQCRPDTQYTFSWESIVLGSDHNTPYIRVAEYDSNNNFILQNLINCLDNDLYKRQTITTSSQTVKLDIRYDYNCSRGQIVNGVMLNIGNIALPYEPYGYKIPIPSGGVTTNIYLGSTQTTRQVKKIVFDGTQNVYSCVRTTDSRNYCCVFRFSDIGMTDIKDYNVSMTNISYPIFISDRFVNKDSNKRTYYNNLSAGEMGANNTDGMNRYIIFCVSGLTTAEEYTDWFTNNPTELYYILGTSTTGIVNEPLMKIGDYVDTLSNAASIPTTEGANSITVDTTVQPSEFTATWTGWHNASVKEYDGSDWQ